MTLTTAALSPLHHGESIFTYMLIIMFFSSQAHALLLAPSLSLPKSAFVKQYIVGAHPSTPSSIGRRNNMRISSPFHIQPAIHNPRYTSSSLSLFPSDTTSLLLSSSSIVDNDNATALKSLAEALGYLIGAASLLLYTPIAVRILRTKSADGLAVSTWWLKLTSFTCTDVYNIKNGFPIAAFSETFVITLEAAVVLGLVTYYQKRIDGTTLLLACAYLILTAWALFSPSNIFPWGPPDEWISFAQIGATVLNASALLPQLKQNFERRASGDYSPVTASLASVGCAVRLFTTIELTDGDPLLLLNYGVALLLNLSVLFQVIYFGTQSEKKSLVTLFLADVKSTEDTEMTAKL